jgi:hypothetical protein
VKPLEWIRRELHAVRASEQGRRFEDAHERHRIDNHAVRVTVITAGCALMVAAAATFWVPGPNFVIVLLALVLVAGQWRLVARLLDRGEVWAVRWHDESWAPRPRWQKRIAYFLMWLAGALVGLAMAYLSWRQGVLPLPDWVERHLPR